MNEKISQQYRIISDDMRFYADQRFKIMTAFLVINGLVVNYVKDKSSMLIAGIMVLLSILFLIWEINTKRWWGTLIEMAKQIEQGNNMLPLYERYRSQNKLKSFDRIAVFSSSTVAYLIYIIVCIAWAIYFFSLFACSHCRY